MEEKPNNIFFNDVWTFKTFKAVWTQNPYRYDIVFGEQNAVWSEISDALVAAREFEEHLHFTLSFGTLRDFVNLRFIFYLLFFINAHDGVFLCSSHVIHDVIL